MWFRQQQTSPPPSPKPTPDGLHITLTITGETLVRLLYIVIPLLVGSSLVIQSTAQNLPVDIASPTELPAQDED